VSFLPETVLGQDQHDQQDQAILLILLILSKAAFFAWRWLEPRKGPDRFW
jgi:hypothetical protein